MRSRVDFYASLRHYAEHILPIWDALEPDERGTFYAHRQLAKWLGARGIDATYHAPRSEGPPVVLAAFGDLRRVRDNGRQGVLVEHGSGQQYSDGHPSNPGGRARHGCLLFLVPSERVAVLNRDADPEIPNAVVGCPKLDKWHGFEQRSRAEKVAPIPAVSFHWNNTQVPEARWALTHYQGVLRDVPRAFPGAIGHGHPRAWRTIERAHRWAGLRPVPEFDDVMALADVYAVDNSSTLFEFAATGRPVVVLNAPWYRRSVNFGLRFWELADVGIQVDEPGELVDSITRALEDPPEQAEKRRSAVAATYPVLDGQAAQRAADAIREHV